MALIDNTNITAEEIAYNGLNTLDDKYQKSIGFFAWDFFVAIGRIIYDLWQRVIYIAKCLTDLNNMDYNDLVNFVYQTRGIVAKVSSASSGELTIKTGAGTINSGAIFETADGTQFQAKETKTVAEGDTIHIQCLTTGIVGNVPANSITVIPTTITGIVAVTNDEAFTNGYENESKEDLLNRYYDDLQNPVASGNEYHYKKWAKEITGVGDAKIKSLWNGDNTVKVVIINSNKTVPSSDLVQAVQNYIDPLDQWGCGKGQAPIGAYCTVVGATAKELNISVSVSLKSGVDLETVKQNIDNSINEYLQTVAFSNEISYISYAKIGAIIMDTDGVNDYSGMTINGSNDNVVLIDNNERTEVAVLTNLIVSGIGG